MNRDDGNPKCKGHEGYIACYVRDAVTNEWRELGGELVPLYPGSERKRWEWHEKYIYTKGKEPELNEKHQRDCDDTIDAIGCACECGWRAARHPWAPVGRRYGGHLSHWDLAETEDGGVGVPDIAAEIRATWDAHMDEMCGKIWTEADLRKHMREVYERERDDRIRKELEAEEKKASQRDYMGRFIKKEHQRPRQVTQTMIDLARKNEPWRWH